MNVLLKTDNIVEILTDPWSEKFAIWEFDIETLQFSKLRDFIDYFETEATQNVKW